MIFCGLGDILEQLFYKPVTHDEIEEAKEFLATYKANMNGLKPYSFNEDMWRDIVDNFNGRPPIKIEAMPEGSVVYPNEPVVQIESQVDGYGELAAYFEFKILQVWAASERATANRHWYKYLVNEIKDIDPALTDEEVAFNASILLHDFGDRVGICAQEFELMGKTHLYSFGGTDTVAGAYLTWKNADKQPGLATSVLALAHRTVQPWKQENDCYTNIFEAAEEGDFVSMVMDCYDFFNAIDNSAVPLALRSVKEKLNKVVVARPDSGDPLEQVLYVLNAAVKNGLYTEKNGYKYPTTLKVLEGDGMTWFQMKRIYNVVKEVGFAPFAWLPYGVGGGLRNSIKRDNFSVKYALCAVGNEDRFVIKIAEVEGKKTLPGLFKVLRTKEALEVKKTVVHITEEGEIVLIEYFNGARKEKPFGIGMDDNFLVIKNRIQNNFDEMPLNVRQETGLFPASDLLHEKKAELTKIFAPNK